MFLGFLLCIAVAGFFGLLSHYIAASHLFNAVAIFHLKNLSQHYLKFSRLLLNTKFTYFSAFFQFFHAFFCLYTCCFVHLCCVCTVHYSTILLVSVT